MTTMSTSSLSSPLNTPSPISGTSKDKGRRKTVIVILKIRCDDAGKKIVKPTSPPAPTQEEAVSTPQSGKDAKSPAGIPAVEVTTASNPSPAPDAASPVNSEGSKAGTPGAKANGIAPAVPVRKRARPSGGALRPGSRAKKPKLDGQTPTANGIGPSRLGPKGNQGAINAHLRALDRSGTQCKRWHKAEFKLKTFTGVEWVVKTFVTEKKPLIEQQPAALDIASVVSVASPNSSVVPMEGVELAPSPGVAVQQPTSAVVAAETQSKTQSDMSSPEKSEPKAAQPSLVAPV